MLTALQLLKDRDSAHKYPFAVPTIADDTVREYPDAQFIISTHSPILLATPGAQILSFDDGYIHPLAYEDTPAYTISRRFLADPPGFLARLLAPDPELE